MSHDDSSKKTEATPKYQQIVVPDHAVKPDTSGTSFLRTGTFPSLTDATKQPPGFRESLALARLAGEHHLKTGGSWHHVDGNRIETTTGRKVEVIAGSYIAHRGPGNSPGDNFSSTWAKTSYTQIGSSDLPIGPQPAPRSPSPPGDPDSDFADKLSFPYSDNLIWSKPPPRPDGKPEPPTSDIDVVPTGSTTNANGALTSGDVASVTWAQRTLTYIGSPTKPVGLAYAETQAGTIKQKNFAQSGNVVSWNHAPFGKFWQDALATTIQTTNEAKGEILVTNTAPNLTTVNVGTQEVINLAPGMLTFTAGLAYANITVGVGITNINVGEQLVINVPDRFQFTLDDGHIKMASSAMTAVDTRLTDLDWKIGHLENKVLLQRADITATNTQLSATKLEMHSTCSTSMAPMHTWGI